MGGRRLMTEQALPYIHQFYDRHGKLRTYFRRNGYARIALPDPSSPDFSAAYDAALKQRPIAKPKLSSDGSRNFARLAELYFTSTEFKNLAASSKTAYVRVVNRFVAEHGHRIVAQMRRHHVMTIMAEKADTPGAANDLLKKLRILIGFAIAHEWRSDDPTLKIKKFKAGEFHTWTEEQIAQFEAKWPLGTRERTAFALHLYTGQRRSDVAPMVWPDVDGGAIRVTQLKTGEKLWVPVHRDLREAPPATDPCATA